MLYSFCKMYLFYFSASHGFSQFNDNIQINIFFTTHFNFNFINSFHSKNKKNIARFTNVKNIFQ
jgi:hypothetical protein